MSNYSIFKQTKMKKNMGSADRSIRVIVAVLIAGLVYFNLITGILAMVLLALAAVFVLTSFVSFCPLHTIVGLSTCPVDENKG